MDHGQLTKIMIDDAEDGHRLNHGHGSRQDAGIVTARFGFHHQFLTRAIDGSLVLENSGDRLEGDADVNGFPIADSALYAA